jgi:hypothetical protein
MRSKPWLDGGDEVTIRRASARDGLGLVQLAALGEARPLGDDVLLAEVDGELWAALDLADGRTIFDPFRPTCAVRRLLGLRRESMRRAAGTGSRLQALRERLA